MNQNKTNFGEKYKATREYLRQFETGRTRAKTNDQQFYINKAVKEDLNKQFKGTEMVKVGEGMIEVSNGDIEYEKMTQEEKNNYYNSLN